MYVPDLEVSTYSGDAVRKSQADFVGIEQAGRDALENDGFTSLAMRAFGNSYVQGAPDAAAAPSGSLAAW